MILRYLSDLHLEFLTMDEVNSIIKEIESEKSTSDEVCILAGDIGNLHISKINYDTFMSFINRYFSKTFVIPGNHEYYDSNIEEMNQIMTDYFKPFKSITFLNNTYEYYNGYCFIGSVLWSKVTDNGYYISDIKRIYNMTHKEYNQVNRECVTFLEETVPNHKNCILITHHMPSSELLDKKYKTFSNILYNQWFYCNMDTFIQTHRNNITCWIYGHTHTPSIKFISEIPMLCNPIGYPNENTGSNYNQKFNLPIKKGE